LIGFVEETVFGLINKITAEETDGTKQIHQVITMLLSFSEKNPGMVRVLIGDALVNEDDRLQVRINQLHDRLEATLKQSLRVAATQVPAGAEKAGEDDSAARANVMLCYVVGRWHQFAKSGFKRRPTEQWDKQAPWLL
jgi:TetR/AcrR family transcriptional regulator